MLRLNHYSFVDHWLLLPKITLTNLYGKERFQNDNSEPMLEHLEEKDWFLGWCPGFLRETSDQYQ